MGDSKRKTEAIRKLLGKKECDYKPRREVNYYTSQPVKRRDDQFTFDVDEFDGAYPVTLQIEKSDRTIFCFQIRDIDDNSHNFKFDLKEILDGTIKVLESNRSEWGNEFQSLLNRLKTELDSYIQEDLKKFD